MLRWLAALTTVTAVSSGCYVHRAIVDPSPAPNTSVTITLTNDGTSELSGALGPGARAVDGRVVPSAPDTIALAVHRVRRVSGRIEEWKGEHVAVPRPAVAGVEARLLSAQATAAVLGGAVAGLVVIAAVIGRFHPAR